MTIEFTEMEKWFPDVNWLLGDEDDQGYGFREFIYVGINMKNKKIALGTFSSGSCEGCGYQDYEKDSINYNEYDEFNEHLLFDIRSAIQVDECPKNEMVQKQVDRIRKIAGYHIPINYTPNNVDFRFSDLK